MQLVNGPQNKALFKNRFFYKQIERNWFCVTISECGYQ